MASVADLVEPDVIRERAGEYLQRAGEVLRAAGRVRLADFGPLRVTAEVEDGGERHDVELAAVDGGSTIRFDCPMGGSGAFCPLSVATAIETWQYAAKRRG